MALLAGSASFVLFENGSKLSMGLFWGFRLKIKIKLKTNFQKTNPIYGFLWFHI
jgi:hypothetical protein